MWSIIGHDRAVALLQRSLETGSMAHAYLFVGPPHIGKMTLALNLAQALNCETAHPPCGQCPACQKIISGQHADVQIIGLNQDKDSARSRAEISIEQIRQIQHSASLPPFEGRCKVFIVDGAECLSNEAANCLLKTLEEPAGKVMFILLTTNEPLLPATVISRCQRVELLPQSADSIEGVLEKNWGVDTPKAKLLARLSRGCPGWAISAARDESLLQRYQEKLDELLDILAGDIEERFACAGRLATQFSHDRALAQERLDLWLNWWHDLLLVKIGCTGDITYADRLSALNDMADGYSLVQIRNFIISIQTAGEQLKQNANPQLVLEVLMLNIPRSASSGGGKPAVQVEVGNV